MGFGDIPKIETVDWYLELAFRNANKRASEMKSQSRANSDSIKRAELAKMAEVRRILSRHLNIILHSFPSIDGMTEFYQELVRSSMDYAELKKSLGALSWADKKISFFTNFYAEKVRRCRDFKTMITFSRPYHGRVGSVLKQIKKQLVYLESARKLMKDFPSIKSGMLTVAIAGFPNVGKTTLLSKITGSTPEIANYAFTTKNINVGYAMFGNHKVQFIDTPGTLDRFEKMNPIERQAHLALKYCADVVVFVFDTSDQTYDPELQMKLLKQAKKYGKDVLVYLSKTDISESRPVIDGSFSDVEALKKKIATFL